MQLPDPTRETVNAMVSGTPGRADPSVGSKVMSERLSRSSTKYGPSVSVGVTTQAGVATPVADGEGEEVEAVWVRPVQAATTTPAAAVRPPTSSLRRDMTDARRGFITNHLWRSGWGPTVRFLGAGCEGVVPTPFVRVGPLFTSESSHVEPQSLHVKGTLPSSTSPSRSASHLSVRRAAS